MTNLEKLIKWDDESNWEHLKVFRACKEYLKPLHFEGAMEFVQKIREIYLFALENQFKIGFNNSHDYGYKIYDNDILFYTGFIPEVNPDNEGATEREFIEKNFLLLLSGLNIELERSKCQAEWHEVWLQKEYKTRYQI